MKPVTIVSLTVAVLVSGCGGTARPAVQTPAAIATHAAPRPTVERTAPADQGPSGLLASLRTRHYADHDQIVFQFHGRKAPPAIIRYVDKVTADPSDKPVPLRGRAFRTWPSRAGMLDTAATENDPSRVRRYRGPTRLSPRYPRLQELAVSGDFEAVLSFGIGLSAVSGLSTATPPASGRLVLDLWRTAPGTLLWPVSSIKQARDVQAATENGHQPWVLDAREVATSYVEHVLGWPHPTVQRRGRNVFQATAGTRSAVITVSQPLSRPDTVWAVASVIRSNG